jgi:hypothetical protein
MAPIAPVYLGIFYLQPQGVWEWGLQGIAVSILFGVSIYSSLKQAKGWIVLVAHMVIVVYWFYSIALIATGV